MGHIGRRYSPSRRSRWFWIAAIVLLALRYFTAEPGSTAPDSLEEGLHAIRRVVDGDTLLLESGARLRLQGIDTPETVKEHSPVEAWGPEASRFTNDFVNRAGGRVRLTFGPERKDQYDRFLAFVWDDDLMLNEELVRAGLARARLDYRYSGIMKRRLSAAQDEARSARRGIWSGRPIGRPRAEFPRR